MKMIPDGQGVLKNYRYTDHTLESYDTEQSAQDNDSIQLQSSEAIALNGLLSDLEFMLSSMRSMRDLYGEVITKERKTVGVSSLYASTAYGVYANKVDELQAVVNKWKPNKK